MIIQSKQYPDNTHEIDIETWEKMKQSGRARRYKVLSTLDYEPDKKSKIPIEVKNFMTEKPEEVVVKKVYDEDKEALDEEVAALSPEKPKKPRKKKVEPKPKDNE